MPQTQPIKEHPPGVEEEEGEEEEDGEGGDEEEDAVAVDFEVLIVELGEVPMEGRGVVGGGHGGMAVGG